MNDYERVAKAIRFLEGNRERQPSLAELAAHLRLSPHHFHRLFIRWAGITPKDFLQALTVEYAKAALRRGESVLDAAHESGLSGSGRLHDLCVTLEAATPGEIKAGGAGMEIAAGLVDSPFGRCLLAQSPRGICHLSFLDDEKGVTDPWDEIRQQWPRAVVRKSSGGIEKLARVIFSGKVAPDARRSPLRVFVAGTRFQVKVWRALLSIPEGDLVSYGALARAAGSGAASRAVGAAVGRNAIGYLIPCHRVILSTGVIHAYRWGARRKMAMLALESASALAPASASANSTLSIN